MDINHETSGQTPVVRTSFKPGSIEIKGCSIAENSIDFY